VPPVSGRYVPLSPAIAFCTYVELASCGTATVDGCSCARTAATVAVPDDGTTQYSWFTVPSFR